MTAAKDETHRKGQTQSWIIERILHRAQPHISEHSNPLFGPWVLMAGIIVIMIVTATGLFIWTGRLLGGGSVSGTPIVSKTLAVGTVTPSTAARPSATPAATTVSSSPTPFSPPTATRAPTVPTAAPSAIKYKVKAGDTLLEIAIKHGVSVQAIMKANGMKNDVIRIGDDLIIPAP